MCRAILGDVGSNFQSNYQCSGGSLQSSHQKNIRFDCNGMKHKYILDILMMKLTPCQMKFS